MNQVTTVLTAVNRLHYLPSQLDSIKTQSIPSDIFMIWRNKETYDLKYPSIIYRNESQHFNSLYGRFYNSLHIKTPYVFIVDDDILPGKKYIERCIEFSKKENDKVVICTYGVEVNQKNLTYFNVSRIGPQVFLDTPTQVDMGGQGWFMKTELLNHFLDEHIIDESTGEDLHFSFCLANKNIPIMILDKDKNDKDTWQDLTLGERGGDDYSQNKNNPTHWEVRDKLLKAYAEKDWKFSRDCTNKYKNRLV
jgi:hypothetical protein